MEELEQESVSQERRSNPFLEITPQMKRKVRKCSFQEDNEDLELDFSSPARNKKTTCETPAPAKSFGRVQWMLEDKGTPVKGIDSIMNFYENQNERGSRFNEDFEEI